MKTKVFLSVAGLAVCGATDAQVRPVPQSAEFSGQTFRAVTATAITALTVDGQYVYGETIELGQGSTVRGGGNVTAYDSLLLADTDGDGQDLDPVCGDLAPHTAGAGSRYFFGTEFSFQSMADDIVPASGTEGGIISELVMAGTRPLCDNGNGGTSEVMQQVITSWEIIDNFPNLDGSDGYDTDGDGLVSPFEQLDTDGDTLVDEFNGGMILTYANTDTDGDTVNDEQLSAGALGYGIFFATGLDTLAIPLPSGEDRHDGSGGGPDGRPDGGIMIQWTRGDGGDMLGDLLGGFYPSTRAQSMWWGTLAMENAGTVCPYTDVTNPGFGAGNSDGIIFGEGQDLCNDVNNAGGDWSTGGPAGDFVVNDDLDPLFDISDWFGFVPDFQQAGMGFRIRVPGGTPPTVDCCDVNGDNMCTSTDFSAWIAAFNGGLPTCDVNQDTMCTSTDFSAWIAAFNASNAGNPLQCTF